MKKVVIALLVLCLTFGNISYVYAENTIDTAEPVVEQTEPNTKDFEKEPEDDQKEQDVKKDSTDSQGLSEKDNEESNDAENNIEKPNEVEKPIEQEPIDQESNKEQKPIDSDTENIKDSDTENIKEPGIKDSDTNEPVIVKAPPSRASNIITYDPDTEKYFYDGEEHSTFPTSGEYVLGSEIILKLQVAPTGTLVIDFNNYDIIDEYTGTNWLFTIQQNDDVTFKGTGNLVYNSSKLHTAIYVNNGGKFTMTDNIIIKDFTTSSNGAAISINHANDVVIMSGNSKVYNCSTSASSGGGGVNVFRGKFYMQDYASIDSCQNTYSAGAEKKGNGAGVQVGNSGTLYMSDNSSIVNCHGTGYHGAGVDLWSSGIMHISGSPTILNNTNGKGFPCNLYAGCPVFVDGIMNGEEHSIGISIQTDPVFTRGLKEHNPDTDIEDLIKIFISDRHYWTDIPRHEEYSIVNHDDIEAEQAPVIVVHFMYNYGEAGEYLAKEVVPGGTTTKPSDPSRTGYNFNGWYKNSECTGSAWSASNAVPVYDDLYLYAKWIPKQYTITTQITEGSEDFVTISESSTQDYDTNYELTVDLTNELYSITSIKIDDTEILTEPVSQYQDSILVNGNHTITVTVEKTKALVTLFVFENEYSDKFIITSNNPKIVDLNSNVEFEYTLEEGYFIEKLVINNEEIETFENCNIENVTEDTNIEVTIGKMNAINISYTGYSDYILEPIEQNSFVLPGSSKQFEVKTQDGYFIEEIRINNVAQTLTYEQTSFNFDLQNILEDQNITIKIGKIVVMPEPTGVTENMLLPICIIIALAFITLVSAKIKTKEQ